jgi:transcriptional regulator of acetoin/glycerol metabolism
LREAIAQLGVTAPLEELGDDFVERLDAYAWPYGLREIREMSWRLGAVLESGNLSAAARRHGLTRQAFSRYLHKRFGDFALG